MVDYSFIKLRKDSAEHQREPAMEFVRALVEAVDAIQPFMAMRIEPAKGTPQPSMHFDGISVIAHDSREEFQEGEFALFYTKPTRHFESQNMKAASYNRVMVMVEMRLLEDAAKDIGDKSLAVSRYAQVILREMAAAHEFYIYSNFSVPEELRANLGSTFDFNNQNKDGLSYESILCGYGIENLPEDLEVKDDLPTLLEIKKERCKKYAAKAYELIKADQKFTEMSEKLAKALVPSHP